MVPPDTLTPRESPIKRRIRSNPHFGDNCGMWTDCPGQNKQSERESQEPGIQKRR